MTPEELKIFEEELQEAIAVWKATDEFTDDLSDLFEELIESTFTKRMPVFPSDDIREECKNSAILACFEYLKKYYDPDKVNPRTGKKTKAWVYFSQVIRCSLAGSWVKATNYKKYFQNES